MTQRTDRVDELLRQEISSLLARDIADPRIGFATVTDVETTPDLRHARVWVSVIGQESERRATLNALERAMPFVRHELGRRLHLRRIPELSVRMDESIERGSRVMQLINELEAGKTPDELPVGESLPTPTPRLHREGDAPEPAAEAPRAPAVRPAPTTGRRTRRAPGDAARPQSAPRPRRAR